MNANTPHRINEFSVKPHIELEQPDMGCYLCKRAIGTNCFTLNWHNHYGYNVGGSEMLVADYCFVCSEECATTLIFRSLPK